MNRIKSLNKISKKKIWDLVVIGGGSSGLGIAVDSASRGYKTVLIEKLVLITHQDINLLHFKVTRQLTHGLFVYINRIEAIM